jgi:hypothetical protein
MKSARHKNKSNLRIRYEAARQLPRGLHHQLVVRQDLARLHDAHHRRFHVVAALLLHRLGQQLAVPHAAAPYVAFSVHATAGTSAAKPAAATAAPALLIPRYLFG